MQSTESPQERRNAAAGVCPMHAPAQRALEAVDELVLPLHKRMIAQYATDAAGARELRLYYGDKEISFDEPELFAFGETLAQQARFVAGAATTWCEGHEWPRIRELLEQLIDEGVLQYADDTLAEERVLGDDGVRSSPLPPAEAKAPRTWFESEELTAQLTGRALETGYLELVIPVFRVAHMTLDAEGRQVGEANVFPPALRLDIPTRWRTCIYAGSRYQDGRPMNVTALKSMRAHWGQMMAALLQIRAAYLDRFPAARQGWTVGHLERLSTAVLALPTYLLMRRDNRVMNGDLHPALSSLFRVTDGLRMTMHQMLFVPVGEPTRRPDAPMSSAEILAYAERNYSFHSEHGVCAGPRAMIEEFLAVLVDGASPKQGPPAQLDAQVLSALAEIEPALDYALLGLKAYAAVFSLWPMMTRAYERLWGIADAWTATGFVRALTLRNRLQSHIDRVKTATYLASESWRVAREQVYADMYAQCTYGLTGEAPRLSLTERITARPMAPNDEVRQQLRAILGRHFGIGAGNASPHLDDVLSCVLDFLRGEQAILGTACEIQGEINALLGRVPPRRAFSGADIDMHNRLQGNAERRLPYLVDELEQIFAMRVSLDKDVLEITDPMTAAPACDRRREEFGRHGADRNACDPHKFY